MRDLPRATTRAATAPPLFETFGDLHRDIGTRVPQAQRYFDQGLRLAYGFNHEAARRAFSEAERLDPDCAMCAWGQALVLGPNINLPMPPELAADATALATARCACAPSARPVDRALIEALAQALHHARAGRPQAARPGLRRRRWREVAHAIPATTTSRRSTPKR